MNYQGLIHKFPVDRVLTDWEIAHRLEIDKPVPSVKPWYQISVIRMNSTYLECVDKFFENKGIISAISVTIILIFAWFGLACLHLSVSRWFDLSPDDKQKEILMLLFVVSLSLFVIALTWFMMFRYEFNRFTHYPIRFNRKNRMVYVTRLDGTVMAESWDKLFFGLADLEQTEPGFCDIRGHRLAEDGRTVLETFAIPIYGHMDDKNLYCLWEFIRRYMQEGPQAFMDDLEIIMDVSDRRETLWNGYCRLATEDATKGLDIVFFPVNFWYAIGRWIAMHTSKIPVWPAEVEAECQIDPDDPYIRDRDNPAEPWDSLTESNPE